MGKQDDSPKVAHVEVKTEKGLLSDRHEATVTLDDGTTRTAASSSKEYAIEKATDKAQRKTWW